MVDSFYMIFQIFFNVEPINRLPLKSVFRDFGRVVRPWVGRISGVVDSTKVSWFTSLNDFPKNRFQDTKMINLNSRVQPTTKKYRPDLDQPVLFFSP